MRSAAETRRPVSARINATANPPTAAQSTPFAAKAKGALEAGGVELALGQEPFAQRLFEPLQPVLIAGNEFPGVFRPCRRCPGFHPRSSMISVNMRFFSK